MAAGLYGRYGGAFTADSTSPLDPKNQLPEGLDLEQVAVHTGMNFSIGETPDLMMGPDGVLRAVPNRKILYREDTIAPLANVGVGYKPVQPLELLDFYRTFLNAAGYQMSAAGIMLGGRRFWAMARTGYEGGMKDDPLTGYLFMGTAVDGSLSTTGFFTTAAMVCWNMALAVIRKAQEEMAFVKIPHSKEFDVEEVRKDLSGAALAFSQFEEDARRLADRKITEEEAHEYFLRVFQPKELVQDPTVISAEYEVIGSEPEAPVDGARVKAAMALFSGAGRGAGLPSRAGTAWGAYNAVTEYVDHHARNRTADRRFHSATLGEGFKTKRLAMSEALLLTN